MKSPHASLAEGDLRQQRRLIVRGLSNINTLNFCVVVLVAALALVAVVLGLRARDDAEKLWAAAVTQARASRFGGEIGWKSNALASIAAASEVRPSLALRNEAIAALATLDLESAGRWYRQTEWHHIIAYDSELKTAAIGELDGSVHWVDLESGEERRRFKCPPIVDQLVFHENGKYLAARTGGGNVRMWNLDNGEEMLSTNVPHQQSTSATLHFFGDALLAGAAGNELFAFSLTNLSHPSVTKTTGSVEVLATVPDGKMLAFSSGSDIQVWDAKGKVVRKLNAGGYVSSLALNASGSLLAAGTADHKVQCWELATGQMQTFAGHHGLVFQVAFNGSGTLLASGAFGGTTRIWEVSSGAALLATESLFINRFGRDENLVGCVRTKAGYGVFRLWDSGMTGSAALPTEPENSVHDLKVLDESRVLAHRSSGAQLKNLDTGEFMAVTRSRRNRGVAVLGRDKIITSSLEGLQVWPFPPPDPEALKPTDSIPVKQGVPNEAIFLSADGKMLLARVGFRGAVLIDIDSKKVRAVFNVPNIGQGVISPDGKWVAIGTFHGHGTKVFNTSGDLIKDIGGRDAAVDFSPNGRWLASAASDACEIYETGTWTRKHRIEMESASGLPSAVAFSRDSKILAFTKQRRIIRLFEPETGTELASLIPPVTRQIDSLGWSPNGNRLVNGTSDALLQWWDIKKLRESLGKLNWRDDPKVIAPEWRWLENIGTLVVIVASVTLIAALLYSLLSWLRHRQFLASYAAIERMIDDRNHELAAAQAELFQSQKMRALGTLAAGIAHDFNNLLSIIRMANRLTAEEARGNAEIQENVRMVEKAVGQGKDVVRSMLGYSRTGGEREDYAPEEVVRQTLSLVSQQFLQGIRLQTTYDARLPRVRGVRNRLEQMLLNLIVNSAEAMKGTGDLWVDVRAGSLPRESFALRPQEATSYIEIAIRDSGPGIPEDVRSRIFEPFFTTKKVGTDRGTGLGLSMVYAVAQEEGIGVSLQTGEGKGTTFRLYLAAVDETVVTPKRVNDMVAA